MNLPKALLCSLGAIAATTLSVLAQPCSLSIPQPNIGTNVASVEPAWWNFDFSAADNASYLSNYVVVDNAGIAPGAYLSWCIDVNDVFPSSPTVNTDVQFFSSCDLNLDTELQTELPTSYPAGVYVSPEIWRQINYLLNHKNGAYFYNVQLAVWTLIGIPIDPSLLSGPNVPPNYPPYDLTVVDSLVADAQANADTWTPVCGDVTAVIEAIDGVTPRDQLIIIEVPTPPSVNAPGGNIGCNPTDILGSILATVSATPGSTIGIAPVGGQTTTGCVVSQQYEITATCSSGVSSSITVTYSWTIDATGPIFSVGGTPVSTPLPPLTFYCYEDFLAYSNSLVVTATDSCSDSPVPAPVICSHSETNPHSSCNNTINLSWCAYNSCGVEGTLTQTITVSNTNKPVLNVPPGYTYGCNPPTVTNSTTIAGAITASSFCGDTPVIHISSVDSRNGCAASRVFTITATDACGNSATQHVTYAWTTNTTPPTLNGVPGNTSLGCNPTSIPTCAYIKSLITATGACGTSVAITITNMDSTNGCAAQREFVITATDACGNAAVAYVTYSWTIDNGPTIVCPPAYTLNTNCQHVYCTFSCGDWSGPCDSGYYGWGNYGNSWWNNWCQQNNNNDCTSSFNNWWLNCNGANAGGTTWWKSWNSQNCGGGWWSGWTSSYSGNWWGCWNKNNYSTQCFVPCSGNNPGSVLCNNFNRIYPHGCAIGCRNGYTVTCDSWQAVQQCLNFTGNPGKLNCNSTDPNNCSAGSFCSQVLALKLNCDFGDDGCSSGGYFFGPFGDCVLNNPSLPCNGKRVRDICQIAQNCLGGGAPPAGCTVSQLCNLVSCFNQCFEGCKVSGWCSSNLCPVVNPPPSVSGYPTVNGGCSALVSTNYVDVTSPMNCPGSYTITRTWTVVDACGASNSCQQTINISQSPESTVVGKVVLACTGDNDLNNNAGFSNVVVTLKQGSATIATDSTDVDGNYAFSDVPAGTYTVVVTPPSGYSETSPTDGRNSQTITVGDCQSGTVPPFGYIGNTPCITLTKCGPFCATNGQTIPYTFTVVNTGDACVNITVTDPMLGGVILTSNSVPPGTIITFTNTYLITNKNVCAITNVATATAVSGAKTATATASAVTLLMTKPCANSICGGFNYNNPGGGYVWCNAHLCSPPTTPCTLTCQGATITFTCNNGRVYTYPVPDCKVTFSTSCTTPTCYFDGACWNTTMPCNGDSEVLLSCCGIPWNNDFTGCRNVCWNGNFSCDKSGYACNWQWGAACYNGSGCNLSNCGNVSVKPCYNTYCAGFPTGDHSCTPENFKGYCTSGGTGGGYGNYCGNWSGSGSFSCH